MKNINEELLSVDPTCQAVEVGEDVQYEPETTSQVVAVEPDIISIGRGRRIEALRAMRNESK